MAQNFFRFWQSKLIDGTNGDLRVDWEFDDIRLLLVDSSYSPDFTNHTNLSFLAGQFNTDPSHDTGVSGRAVSDGRGVGAQSTFANAVADGTKNLVCYKLGAGVSPLIAYWDSPVVNPNGGSIVILWSGSIVFSLH